MAGFPQALGDVARAKFCLTGFHKGLDHSENLIGAMLVDAQAGLSPVTDPRTPRAAIFTRISLLPPGFAGLVAGQVLGQRPSFLRTGFAHQC